MQSINDLLYELNMMRKTGRPKGVSRDGWKKRMNSLRKRISELEAGVDTNPARSSGDLQNSFWQVSQQNNMRETLGTGWDHKKTQITDHSKHSQVPYLMGTELKQAIRKRFKKLP